MSLQVFDFRTDVRNIVVTPEIRGRFLRMEPGEVANRHSHDLGHEMFLILAGQCEFEISGERAVLGPGQACFARRDELHQVRVVGDEPMTMYLSVTPHIEPTHTQWTADPSEGGEKQRPRYGGWKSPERDGIPDPAGTIDDLVERHVTALRALTEIVEQRAANQEPNAQALKRAVSEGDREAARRLTDALWADLFPIFRAISELGEAWNDLAFVAGESSRAR